MGKKLTRDEFIQRSIDIHGDVYDYSKSIYNDNRLPIEIICKKHGSFFQSAWNHFCGKGCKQCANELLSKTKRKTKEQFIIDAQNIHGDKYNYSLVNYKTTHFKVKIICPEHGIFEQTPANHLFGQVCPDCANDKRSLKHSVNPTGWSLSNWVKVASTSSTFESFKTYLILAGCNDTKEYFLKVGRTYLKLHRRLKSIRYEYIVICIYEGSADDVYRFEIYLKSKFKRHKYLPSTKFEGEQECFSLSAIDGLMQEFEKLNGHDKG